MASHRWVPRDNQTTSTPSFRQQIRGYRRPPFAALNSRLRKISAHKESVRPSSYSRCLRPASYCNCNTPNQKWAWSHFACGIGSRRCSSRPKYERILGCLCSLSVDPALAPTVGSCLSTLRVCSGGACAVKSFRCVVHQGRCELHPGTLACHFITETPHGDRGVIPIAPHK